MIPGSANPLLLATAAAGGYSISRSVRFNSSDSAYLSRTPASAGNRKTWTWAGWVKRGALDTEQNIFGTNSPFGLYFQFQSNNTFKVLDYTGSAQNYFLITSRVFRDPGAWLHIVFLLDTTQSTANNRVRLYVNGIEVSDFSTRVNPSLNYDGVVNTATSHTLGRLDNQYYFNGYLADIHFIDGQALTPTSFGEFSATTGVWMPKQYAGTYGTNGFKLSFSDNSTAAALGTDVSGAGNTWTVNNLSVTAGAGNDSLVDVPTNGSEVDTGSGGQVRGNYCTANPLAANGGATFSNGNLDVATPTDNNGIHICTIGITSGKWYWESTITNANPYAAFGITKEGYSIASGGAGILGASSTAYAYMENGQKYNNSSASAYGNTFTTNDVIGVAFDADAGSLFFYKNGVAQNSGTAAFTGLTSGPYFPAASDRNTSTSTTIVHNFGARSFAYTAPSGFKALNTASLPSPLVTKPTSVFDVKLYTGNGGTQTISGLGFSPDLVWLKARNNNFVNGLFDTVRGPSRFLVSNSTVAELVNEVDGYLSAFTSDGFTLSPGTSSSNTFNSNAGTQVAWTWDAGSSTVTNTQGSITSSVRANATAGFSIVTYTGNGTSGATVGHGLNVAPQLLIVKRRSSAGSTANWAVWHGSLTAGQNLFLNTTDSASAYSPSRFTSTLPTSTVFSIGGGDETNYSGGTFVCYAFSPVSGYSSMGSFTTSSASTDGVFVYTNHRPRWVLIKETSATGPWIIYDAVRNTYNAANNELRPNTSEAENGGAYLGQIDILSNGFKIRSNSSAYVGEAGDFIYCSFAESPFAANNRAR